MGGNLARNIWLTATAFALVAFTVPAGAQQPGKSLAEDAAAFGAREAISAVDLSADGTQILYLTPGKGRRTVAMISNVLTGTSEMVVASSGDPESLSWCSFVAAKRAVCRYGGTVDQAGTLIGASRLIASDINAGNVKLLGQKESPYDAYIRQFDGDVIDWLGSQTGSVLMARVYVPEAGRTGSLISKSKDGLGVDRIDTVTLKSKSVEPIKDASGYMTDGRGNVRLMYLGESTTVGQLTGRTKYWYRRPGSRDWEILADYQDDDDFRPLTLDADLNALYVLKTRNGRQALYTIKLDGTLATALVAEHPRVDIGDVFRFGEGQRVIGYTYSEEKGEKVYFDPQFKALAASLSRALPNLPDIGFVDSSADGSKLLLFAGSDRDPGRYYLFDRTTKNLNELMLERPELEGRSLAEVKPVTIPAADGASIPAYLTLPPGKQAKGLPAVILPHGGPAARDYWGFNWIAQFLAARGYAVIQPNYRGSAGYGEAWLNENGYRNWRTSIGDITASARWLASQGIADPKRLAILGWSYGGYAALQSAATEPSLYKAVVAIAPVTDLAMLKQDERGYTSHKLREQQIGTGPHLIEGSPLRNATAIRAPVLLVHGTLDSNVRFAHSQKMQDALRSAGGPSELVQFQGLDHQLEDSGARTQMLTKIGQLLERTIGH